MTITVSQHTPGQLRQTIRIHSHQINADLTQAAGGSDTGPDPHDLFDAAVATCKAMTLQLFAKRKNIPLDEVKVEISRDDSAESKGLYQLYATLELIGDLTKMEKLILMRPDQYYWGYERYKPPKSQLRQQQHQGQS